MASPNSKAMKALSLLALAFFVQADETKGTFNVVVSQDGAGNFKTISEAVAAAPTQSDRRYYIKINAGIYMEHVQIGRDKPNLVFIGDGLEKTIIIDQRSNSSGWGTYFSATVDVQGDNFVAMDITFKNSAGRKGKQAVAMKSSSNLSAFYRCRFEGFQDTLLVDTGMQFYKECRIYGTVDFIFGEATVVIQDSEIYIRNPGRGRPSVITAHRRMNLSEPSGISIHRCKIMAAKRFAPRLGKITYLGRPWGGYSRVVVMQSLLDDVVNPVGWSPWEKDPSSLDLAFYGEYQNYGPGASVAHRVRSKAFRVMNESEAAQFTVRNFIYGDRWIPSTNIPFDLDLT